MIPYGFIVPIFCFLCLLFIVLPMEKVLNMIWIGILISSFLGAYLGLPSNQNIFLFRILLILHCVLFPVFLEKKWGRMSSFQILFFILGVWLFGNVISLFWASVRAEALRYIYYVFEACYLIFLTVYYVHDRKTFKLFSNVIIGFYIIALSLGLVEVTTGWHMSLSGSLVYETTTSHFQPTAFLFNTNDYAMFLAIFLPFVFCGIWKFHKRPWNICLAILVLTLSLYLVITTYSRLGIISIILETVIICLLYLRKTLFFFIFCVVIYLLINSFLSLEFGDKITEIIVSAFTKKGASTDDRMDLYQAAWEIIRDSNFMGVGAGNVPIKIHNYLTGHETVGNIYRATHNFWLESMGGIGLFSFAIIAFMLFLTGLSFRFWWRNRNQMNTVQYIVPMLIVFVFCLSSVALSSIIEKRYLWLALGIAIRISCANITKSELEN
ncbi:O-antigen ligase family protein [Bacillus cereus group sp. BfR-BA-01354]|uniref:O-antigen ligase family protein n=1 Tax=Bacillus cereus group TaxID=86661 RepID=UPI001F574EE2